ncbi:copper-containing nitrite reductase [Motiliproteus sp. SC1-56]|uniref:copper-containing nitrite reductase n=1 Tax=Motiliproteus sp. SC1-56 TaxID=2799565 RepID=UPI001F5CC84C|nr:copper-containing nitrite reductase [Motiliproteus sp. SC1-56]
MKKQTTDCMEPEGVSRRGFIGATVATVGVAAAASLMSSQAAAGSRPVGAAVPAEEIGSLRRVKQTLVPPPFAPVHDQVATGGPKVVEVRMVVEEKLMDVDGSGAKVWACTFNGSMPGPLIVCHEGDYVELTLVNPASNQLMHNIDFHAATGGLGGGALTEVSPGEEVVLRFRATKAGTFVYHCAPGGQMIPFHVVSGMNGAIMVLPRDGLKDPQGNPVRYDRAYYVGEQDLYLPKDANGKYKVYDSIIMGMPEMLEVMKGLTPTHVVFNGAVGALTGKNAMKAKVGESVLIVHSQANRDTRPHLIGGHGDLVWSGGSFNDTPSTNLETWHIPGGAAAAALYTFHQPGTYAYVNHNLIEAILLGAAAHFQVEGAWNDDLMTQVRAPGPIKA